MLLNKVLFRSEHVFTSDRKLLEQQLCRGQLNFQDHKKEVKLEFHYPFFYYNFMNIILIFRFPEQIRD